MTMLLSHATVWCLDQRSARAFYTERLGFEVRTEAPIGPDVLWLTVGLPRQADVELVLTPIAPPMVPADRVDALRELVAAGVLGGGVLRVDDCRAAYEELRARGVEFRQPPTERSYGIEAVLRDDSGNWFSLVERSARASG